MPFDISVMKTNATGTVDYRFSGLNDRIVGSNKLVQHFIKHLYGDHAGGLLTLVRGTVEWGETEIRIALLNTSKYMERMQLGKSLHPAEKYVGIKITKIEIQKRAGIVSIEFIIKTQAGQVAVAI